MPFLNPTYIIALLIAVSIHEWAHAITATKLGDPTPGNAGRLTLNPLAHLDPVGAILFLTVGFGWAKPVPISPVYFRNHKRGVCLTALAGPFSNFVLAAISFAALRLLGQSVSLSPWTLLGMQAQGSVAIVFLTQLFGALLFVNLGLMAFNLLPVAPLDGSKVLEAFVPLRYSDKYDEFMRIGSYVLLGLFLAEMFLHIPLLSLWIVTIMEFSLRVMEMIL
ncbi:site-2 protease family protein [Candidatus Peribacteria bacterium]|nr:site-2 protease family protein [Candidatus Peribacteria bacterium]